MATQKMRIGTLANLGWKLGVNKSLQYGEINPLRVKAGLGPDPLTKWRFFVVTPTETWGADSKKEAEALWASLSASRVPKPFSQWVREDAPANSAGAGGIPGIGIGSSSWAEPGIDLRKKRPDLDPLAEAADALELARDSAMDNELATVEEMGKYRKETPENKHGIAQVRAFRRAGTYADMHHVDADALKERICGAPKGSPTFRYFEKECYKKLYEDYGGGRLSANYEPESKQRKAVSKMSDQELLDRIKTSTNLIQYRFKLNIYSSGYADASRWMNAAREEITARKARGKWTLSEAVEAPMPDETFAGASVFHVGMDEVMKSRAGKLRYHRYSRYVGESEKGEQIRQHGRGTKNDIVLKDEKTGVMTYLRRKAPKL